MICIEATGSGKRRRAGATCGKAIAYMVRQTGGKEPPIPNGAVFGMCGIHARPYILRWRREGYEGGWIVEDLDGNPVLRVDPKARLAAPGAITFTND